MGRGEGAVEVSESSCAVAAVKIHHVPHSFTPVFTSLTFSLLVEVSEKIVALVGPRSLRYE